VTFDSSDVKELPEDPIVMLSEILEVRVRVTVRVTVTFSIRVRVSVRVRLALREFLTGK